jgi:hypothetical protein
MIRYRTHVPIAADRAVRMGANRAIWSRTRQGCRNCLASRGGMLADPLEPFGDESA